MSDTAEPIRVYPTDRPGIELFLRRLDRPSAADAKPVLLLHGASANYRTFVTPRLGHLAGWLHAAGADPWMLDWRGSSVVVANENNRQALTDHAHDFTFNAAAQHDLRAALLEIENHYPSRPKVGVVGFCMGAALLAEAIAREFVTTDDIDAAVLMTLGLFYEAPIDGRLKCEERVLERLDRAGGADRLLAVDPREGPSWPDELKRLYDRWPKALKSHDEPSDGDRTLENDVHRICNHLSFMYGMPYNHPNLADEIHEISDREPALKKLFGGIPLHMYIHGAQNIRRGRATVHDDESDEIVTEEARQRFHRLPRVTLITGALNRLWHRDSVDRMHEWLCRGGTKTGHIAKHVLPNYGHQDLLWGKTSQADVFPLITRGLGLTSPSVPVALGYSG